MRINELISEAISRTVYHYTSIGEATSILESGVFELSSVFGSGAEEELNPSGYPYYLSTTRTPLGDYHRHVLHDGVLFVLDGEWFNRRYRGAPINYHGTLNTKPRQREAEDRIFSRHPTIGIGGIREIHVLERSPAITRITSGAVRRLLILARRRGISAFFYDEAEHWRILSRHRAVQPGSPHRQPPLPRQLASRGSPLTRWLELIHKDRADQLTAPARVLLHDLLNPSSVYWDDHYLSDHMNDGRKPGSPYRKHAVRIIDHMQSHQLRTLRALILHLIGRWRRITGGSFRADEPGPR
jgi:hypothetical protein